MRESPGRIPSQSQPELNPASPLLDLPKSPTLRKSRASSETYLNVDDKRKQSVLRGARGSLTEAKSWLEDTTKQGDVEPRSSSSEGQAAGARRGQKRKRSTSLGVQVPSPSTSPLTPDSQTSILACPLLPLTETNLQLHSGATMATPVTPSKSSSSIKDTTVSGIRRVLYDNKMFIDDEEAYKRYPEVEGAVNHLVRADRDSGSGMQPESRERIQETRKEFATANELTFLVEVWKLLVHDSRNIKTMSATDKVAWIKQAWKKDGLRLNWQADFVRTALPTLVAPNPVYAKLLESLPRVKVPKPDLSYGLRVYEFDEKEQMINDTLGQYSTLSRDLCHAFFIVEAKSSEGTIEDAENQCCRGGAALVHARMRFNAKAVGDNLAIGEDLTLGADLKSIAFSLAIVPSAAHLFVHWAEVRSRTSDNKPAEASADNDDQVFQEAESGDANVDEARDVCFHMNLVEGYHFRARNDNAFPLLRKDIENVLDWGILRRKNEVKQVLKQISSKLEDVDAPQPAKKKRRGC